jgi:hypothetical protein
MPNIEPTDNRRGFCAPAIVLFSQLFEKWLIFGEKYRIIEEIKKVFRIRLMI